MNLQLRHWFYKGLGVIDPPHLVGTMHKLYRGDSAELLLILVWMRTTKTDIQPTQRKVGITSSRVMKTPSCTKRVHRSKVTPHRSCTIPREQTNKR